MNNLTNFNKEFLNPPPINLTGFNAPNSNENNNSNNCTTKYNSIPETNTNTHNNHSNHSNFSYNSNFSSNKSLLNINLNNILYKNELEEFSNYILDKKNFSFPNSEQKQQIYKICKEPKYMHDNAKPRIFQVKSSK